MKAAFWGDGGRVFAGLGDGVVFLLWDGRKDQG